MAVAIATAVLLVGYGIVEQTVLLPRRAAATVNGDVITRQELAARSALARADLVQQSQSLQQMMGFFADSPEALQSMQSQIALLNAQINNPDLLARQVLQDLMQARLVRQEAQRRGIVVSQTEIDRAVEEAFGFFAGGTPTVAPTATADPTLAAQSTAAPTFEPSATPEALPSPPPATATATATATPGASPTPLPSPTAFTRQAFEAEYAQYLADLSSVLRVQEDYLRDRFEERLYEDRLRASLAAEVLHTEQQVWARHILVPEQAVAFALLSRLRQGDSWDELAAAFSQDTSNKDRGGDLGWFGRGAMVDAFEQAAYEIPPGEIGSPVQTGFGWHLIQVIDRAERKLDPAAYDAAVERAYQAWLLSAVEAAELIFDPEIVPPTPTPGPTPTPTPTTG